MRTRPAAAIAVVLLGLALAAPAGAAAAERVVSVSADATIKVPNDTVSFGFSVVRERRKRGAALRAASGKLRAVIAAVREIPGVGPGDVTTGRVSVRKAHRRQRVFWRASEGIGVTLHQVENAGELIGVALAKGASGLSGPNYFVSDPAGAFGLALAQAYETAKAKASALALQSGSALGPAVSIDEGEGAEFVPGPVEKDHAAGCVVGSPDRLARGSKARASHRHRKRSHSAKRSPHGHRRRGDSGARHRRTRAHRSATARAKRARSSRARASRVHPRRGRALPRCGTTAPPTKPGTSTVTAHVHVVFELR